MDELLRRKPNRLKDYDYSRNGCYFVTICVKGRQKLLGNVGANCVRQGIHQNLSAQGKIIEKEIGILSETYDSVNVDKYVIMPNHIHMIIIINVNGQEVSRRTQFAPTVSRIIKQFKGSITKKIGSSIWQRSFHDHIIRNEADYQRIWLYIDMNIVKWEEDCYYV
ncbi:MAG: transposase [Defluviitaleaceae bacterium]|nr:transposase [Defluviitaleaceae bacterium]